MSDPHANLPAVLAVLEQIREAKPDALICLGDVIGYGAQPNEVIAEMRQACDLILSGNHDLAILGKHDHSDFRDHAKESVNWTRAVLGDDEAAWLGGLGPQGSFEGADLFHASPRDPVSEYVQRIEVAEAIFESCPHDSVFVGHTHVVAAYRHDAGATTGGPMREGRAELTGRWIVNPGSVGQPRDNDPRAAWMLWDTSARYVESVRVTYDVAAAQRAIRAAGLPSLLADRLELGR